MMNMDARVPELFEEYGDREGRIILGEKLVLTWGYHLHDNGPKNLHFEARDPDGSVLATLAVVPVLDGAFVPASIVAEVLRGTAAVARRAFLLHAHIDT